jgi:hypothetical protein
MLPRSNALDWSALRLLCASRGQPRLFQRVLSEKEAERKRRETRLILKWNPKANWRNLLAVVFGRERGIGVLELMQRIAKRRLPRLFAARARVWNNGLVALHVDGQKRPALASDLNAIKLREVNRDIPANGTHRLAISSANNRLMVLEGRAAHLLIVQAIQKVLSFRQIRAGLESPAKIALAR